MIAPGLGLERPLRREFRSELSRRPLELAAGGRSVIPGVAPHAVNQQSHPSLPLPRPGIEGDNEKKPPEVPAALVFFSGASLYAASWRNT